MLIKNKFLIQFLIFIFFANVSFAQQDKMNELLDKLDKIQKDIQTLEKAVYTKNPNLPSDNISLNEALTRQLTKISELEKQKSIVQSEINAQRVWTKEVMFDKTAYEKRIKELEIEIQSLKDDIDRWRTEHFDYNNRVQKAEQEKQAAAQPTAEQAESAADAAEGETKAE